MCWFRKGYAYDIIFWVRRYNRIDNTVDNYTGGCNVVNQVGMFGNPGLIRVHETNTYESNIMKVWG